MVSTIQLMPLDSAGAAWSPGGGDAITAGAAMTIPNALSQIVERKRLEVERGRAAVSLESIRARATEAEPPRNFFQAVTADRPPRTVSVIAEIKRKSPSAGWLREEYRSDDFDPAPIAKAYHRAGAAAISCLTDAEGFGGDLDYIRRIRNRVPLPVLRKDFIIDAWQIYESRAASADAVLLIADILTEGQFVDLLILATELKMTSIVEVHDVESLLRVRHHIGFPHPGYTLLGINNRDLRTMTTDLGHTLRLLDMVEDKRILISESGIRTHDDVERLRKAGVGIVLVGEQLMKQEDPGAALEELLGQ
ncbi:MAG: indole-3-glycerol phosphate synthase TrpC [Phycisphaerales bacterium]|nr:indole-3-glycerol phosphate synthase TrpC [Phycisphaerales bacterium]